jgi:hypothetical protein
MELRTVQSNQKHSETANTKLVFYSKRCNTIRTLFSPSLYAFVFCYVTLLKVKLSLCLTKHPRHKDLLEDWRYSSTNSLPCHWLEVSGQIHAPDALPQGKGPLVPIGQEAGWTPETAWTQW